MFETWSYRRMATFVFALISISVLIFVFEEVAEESDFETNYEISTSQAKSKDGKAVTSKPNLVDGEVTTEACYLKEPFVVVQKCAKCSDFERKAIKAKHCVDTGFFERVNCTRSSRFALRSCRSKEDALVRFNVFGVCTVLLAVLSYFVTAQRKSVLHGFAYSRLQQQLG